MRISRVKAAMATASLTVALGGIGGIGASTALAASAEINKDFSCALFDGNGNLVVTDQSHSVVTQSGNSTLKCSADVTPPRSGQAAHFSGFGCNTFLGFTNDSRETVSASGKATLTCRVRQG